VSSAADTAADILEGLAAPLGAGLAAIPVAGAIVGPAVTSSLALAAFLLRRGLDVPATIQRIRRSPEILAAARVVPHAEERWSDAIDRRFGAASEVPLPPDTRPTPVGRDTVPSVSAADIYDEASDDDIL
jgi:hypothetical protein